MAFTGRVLNGSIDKTSQPVEYSTLNRTLLKVHGK
jgi:hypothetical protein